VHQEWHEVVGYIEVIAEQLLLGDAVFRPEQRLRIAEQDPAAVDLFDASAHHDGRGSSARTGIAITHLSKQIDCQVVVNPLPGKL
jgi:hypothetical protein